MRKILLALAVLLLVAVLALGAWLLLLRPVDSSGWLCCITAAGSTIDVCVQVPGIDSDCDGGTVGWCEHISEDATGQADCLD